MRERPMLVPEQLTEEAFVPFGRIIRFGEGGAVSLIATEGDGWLDRRTPDPLLDDLPSLGVTVAGDLPREVAVMERHSRVQEAILPAAGPIVLTVAPAGAADAPRVGEVRSFLLEPLTVAVLAPGVWHAECHGVDGVTPYYWLSSCVDAGSSPWTPIEDGPVLVERPAFSHARSDQ